MKITKTQLKQIIKEELEKVMRTAGSPETAVVPMGKAKTTRSRPPSDRNKNWHDGFDALPEQAKKWHVEVRALSDSEDRQKQLQDIAVRSSHSTDSQNAIKALEAFYEEYGVWGDR